MALKKPGQRGYKPRHNAKPAGQPGADMFSYDNALPCKNPKCKSVGKPHPNCKCYGSAKSMPQRRLTLAEGGQVGHYCDQDQFHMPDCEYFSAGGLAIPGQSLAQTGAGILKGFGSSIQGQDEHSGAMMGQGDPTGPVSAAIAHMGAMGLLDNKTSSSSGLKDIESSKMADRASGLLDGLGYASSGLPHSPGQDSKSFKDGMDLFHKIPEMISNPDKGHLEKKLDALTGGAGGKYGLHAALRTLGGGNVNDLYDSLDYSSKVSKGASKINKGLDGLFDSSSKGDPHEASEPNTDKLKKYIEDGTFNKSLELQAQSQAPQMFADGGMTETQQPVPILAGSRAVANNFPEQDMLLQAAKARINNYLDSSRPQPSPMKLAYDKEMKDPEKERSYSRALGLASNPLDVLNHIKHGTLTLESMKHFTQMFPELHDHLSQKMTQKITEHQLDEEKLPYKVRQSMSLFMGVPLDSTMTPASIQSIQGVYAQNKANAPAQPQPHGGAKKTPKGMDKMAETVQSAEAARTARANA